MIAQSTPSFGSSYPSLQRLFARSCGLHEQEALDEARRDEAGGAGDKGRR